MKIYNLNTQNLDTRILDPDNQSNDYLLNHCLHSYFKQLYIPEGVIYLIGIYIEFEIGQLIYEDNKMIYQNALKPIQNKIETYLDFGNAQLLNMNSNAFFITMFDVIEDTLVLACLDLYKDLSQQTFKKYKVNIHTGIYFSNPHIHAYQFFEMAKEQFENTLEHDHTLISVKYLSTMM